MKNKYVNALLQCGAIVMICLVPVFGVRAQQADQPKAKIVFSPTTLKLHVNETAKIKAHLEDPDGNVLADTVFFYTRDRRAVSVSSHGEVKAMKPGSYEAIAIKPGPRNERVTARIPIEVAYPPLAEITYLDMPDHIYAGTDLPLQLKVNDELGFERSDAEVSVSSSNPAVASVDALNMLNAHKPGSFTLTAKAGDVTKVWKGHVTANPVVAMEIKGGKKEIRTGDVLHFNGLPQNNKGKVVKDAPVTYTFMSRPSDDLGEGATAQIEEDGRFVAAKPGLYTVLAKSGPAVAEYTVRAVPRNVKKKIEVAGHGEVYNVHTSDFWVWEGIDGRDYAVTGTWGANGEAYFWDVTDPASMHIIDTVKVDARTVNDVKVSEDGTVCVITREGASNRKNGIVILDVKDPHNVKLLSTFNDGLTGGVHNSFIYKKHVYAVNNGRRYDIINIEDPTKPYRVSRFELDTPGHAIHDVWIEDGIAYSSNWDDGVVAVDVGSGQIDGTPEKKGVAGGSPSNPVKLGSYSYPSGWNHAAFPFKSQSTGNFYVVAGDEAFPYGLSVEDHPNRAAGWLHFVEFDDWNSPKEVARYQVPEAGSHNFWVKNDTLYAGYYSGGLRVVDISGELMGNLYDQGREIANFRPTSPDSYIPNSTFTWGAQPYKGYIFISDWNSGLWALKLVDADVQGTH